MLGGEFAFQDFLQPLQGHFFGEVGDHFDALEIRAKSPVKFIEMLFVFDQGGAAQVIKVIHAARIAVGADHIGLQGFEQAEVFLDRHGQFSGSQRVEKINQHGKPLSLGKQAFDGVG